MKKILIRLVGALSKKINFNSFQFVKIYLKNSYLVLTRPLIQSLTVVKASYLFKNLNIRTLLKFLLTLLKKIFKILINSFSSPVALFALFPVFIPINFIDHDVAECLTSAWEQYRIYVETKIQNSSENRKPYWLKILQFIDHPEDFSVEREEIEKRSKVWKQFFNSSVDRDVANKTFLTNWLRQGWDPDSDSGELESVINKTAPFIFLKKEIFGKIKKCFVLFLTIFLILYLFYSANITAEFSNFDIFNSSSLLSYIPFNKGIRREETIEKIGDKEKLFPISEENSLKTSFEQLLFSSKNKTSLDRKGKGKKREVEILSRIEEEAEENYAEANDDKFLSTSIFGNREELVEKAMKSYNLKNPKVLEIARAMFEIPDEYTDKMVIKEMSKIKNPKYVDPEDLTSSMISSSNASTSDYGTIISSKTNKIENKTFNLDISPNRNKPLPPLPEEAYSIENEISNGDISRDTIESLMNKLQNPTPDNTNNSIFEDNSLNESVINDIADFADEVYYEGGLNVFFLVFLLKNSKIKILKFIIKIFIKMIIRILIIYFLKWLFAPIWSDLWSLWFVVTYCDSSIISMSIAEYEEWLREFSSEKHSKNINLAEKTIGEKSLPNLPGEEKDLPNIPSKEKELPNLPSEEKINLTNKIIKWWKSKH